MYFEIFDKYKWSNKQWQIKRERKHMAITRLKHHDNCTVKVKQCKHTSAHYAELRCEQCNTHIQWLNRQEAQKIAPITNGKDFMFTRAAFE